MSLYRWLFADALERGYDEDAADELAHIGVRLTLEKVAT